MNKNIVMSLILYSFVALLVVGMAIGINVLNDKKKEEKKDAVTEQLIQFGMDEDEALNLTEEEAEDIIEEYANSYYYSGYTFDPDLKEYTDSERTMNLIMSYIGDKKWKAIVDLVSPLEGKYNFTTVINQNIITAYKDAMLLVDSDNWTEDDWSAYLFGANNKECFLMGLLTTPGNKLLNYYLDETGLWPMFTDRTELSSEYFDISKEDVLKNLENDKYYYKIKDYLEGYNSLAKIEVSGRTAGMYDSATCYIAGQNNYLTRVIGCYNPASKNLFTVAEWNNIKY